MNPFLAPFKTPFGSVPFNLIQNDHFIPALEKAISEAENRIEELKSIENPTFENFLVELEKSGRQVGVVAGTFFNLNSAETSDELQQLAHEFSPRLTAYQNKITLDEKLFDQVKKVYDSTDLESLDTFDRMLLEKTYKQFKRNGAEASTEAKEAIKKIDEELATLKVTFGQHVLAATNAFELLITDEKDLAGIPDSVVQGARETAQSQEKEGWMFTLQYPSYVPFMTYAENRELREKLFRAFASRAYGNPEQDNREIVTRIAELRAKRAALLGYKSHAEYVLEERMAKTPAQVQSFLDELLDLALPVAKEQINEVSLFAAEKGAELPLQRWDFSFWSEKLKKSKYDFDDELLKPYFPLEQVIDGVFETANRLYGLTFKPNQEVALYHPEVMVYEVYGRNEEFISLFYADFFPRAGKRPGAWMTSYRDQYREGTEDFRPHISIVCNFNKPTSDKPSLLTFNEVKTLFHEFGHALHGMLSQGKYQSLSGTNVYWDFVELPSQILENWCYEKECLDLFARHYETGEALPEELLEKVKQSATFLEGYQTIRQLSFGLLDMAWHHRNDEPVADVAQFEQQAVERTALLPGVEGTNSSCAFAHIFSGGYSSGYYSYKWAEVLDADAFEAFQEKGIFNAEVADRFRENILEKGGSEHPSVLYKRFRGKDPALKPLLKRAGLV
ncbi:M3 family metallopeptidase [bacterium SCSIO 12741]|nr:M3 family metallopeptidase [bacterium SCSIO 12741]